jgi:PAS domain S-box-containing protein
MAKKKPETNDLQESELRYRRLFETAQDGILLLDAGTGRITDVNPFLLAMLGYSREEMLGKNLWEIGAFKDIKASKKAFAVLQEKDYMRYENLPLETKAGQAVQVEFVSNVYEVGDRKVIQCNVRDITERKLVEQSLKRSEERFRRTFDQSPIGIATAGLDYHFISANKTMCLMLGYSEEELKGKTFKDVTHPEDLARDIEEMQRLTRGEIDSYEREKRYVRKDGSIFWGHITVGLIRDEKGKPLFYTPLIQNINDLKRAEEILRESEEKYRNLVERANDGICLFQDRLIKYANPKLAEIWGGSVQEILDTPFTDHVHPDDLSMVIDRYNRRMAGEQLPTSYEAGLKRKDGSKVYVELNVGVITYLGKPAELVIIRDITDRRQAEEALHESEKRFRDLTERTSDWIWEINAKGAYTYSNWKVKDILGYSPEEIIGKTPLDFIIPEEKERIAAEFQAILEKQKPFANMENTNLHREGRPVVLETNGVPVLDSFGQLQGYRGIDRDITERKQAEEAIKYSEEFLNNIIEKSPFAMWISDSQGTLVRTNQALRDLLHTTDEELVGKYNVFKDNIVEEQGFMPLVKNVFEKGETAHFVLTYKSSQLENLELKNKVSLVLDVTISAVKDTEGRITNAIIQHVDITERVQAQEKIDHLASFPELNPDPVSEFAVDGKVIYANAATKQLFPDLDKLGAKHPYLTGWETITPQLMASGHTSHMEREVIVSGHFYLQTIQYLKTQNIFRVYTRDISERKKAEAELQKYELMASNSNGIILFLDRDSGRILEANAAAVKAYGYSRDELLTKTIKDLRAPDTLNAVEKQIRKADSEGILFETKHKRRDSSLFPVEVSSRGAVVGGQRTLVSIIRDITERKRAEAEIIKLNRLYAVISQINQAVVHALTQKQFLEDVCDVITTYGNFKLAWISRIEKESKRVIPVVSAGEAREYTDGIIVYADDRPEGRGPVGTCIRQHKPVIQNDFISDPNTAPWRERAEKYGLRGAAAFPIQVEGQIWGALTVYSDTVGFFGQEEVKLLQEAVGDIGFALDNIIKEKQRLWAEEALRQSEEKYRLLIENANDIVYSLSAEGIFTYVSPSWEKLLGHNTNEVMNHSFTEFIHPDDIPKSKELVKSAALTGDAQGKFEYQVRHKDGAWRWHSSSVTLIFDAEGNFEKSIAIASDITDRKQAEKALAESEEKYHLMADNMSEVIILMDLQLKHVYVSPSFIKSRGWLLEEFDDMPLEKKMPPASQQLLEKTYAENFTPERLADKNLSISFEMEMDVYNKNGTITPVEDTVSLIRDANGNPTNIMIVSRDITKRKQASDALKESEYRYRQLFTSMTEGFALHEIIVDGAGKPYDYRFLEMNPAFTEMTGFKAEDVIGRTAREVLPDLDGVWIDAYGDVALSGHPTTFENYSAPLGKWFAVFSYSPGPGRFATIFSDITKSKQAEEAAERLRQKAEMSSRLAAVGEMAAGIAHEINNPLTSVIGFSELLMEHNLPPEVTEELKIIADGSHRVADIVKRLLTFARQSKPVRTPVQINALIDNTIKLRSYVLETANIRVFTCYDETLPWIIADPSQMQQVFLNLIVNAEHAMKTANNKGELKITTEKHGQRIRIVFSDDGPGINSETLSHLFEPFYTTKGPAEGTGLGLSLSRSIVLEHGGEIWAESEEGQGATFIVELPITEAPEPSAEAKTQTSTKGARQAESAKIMVIDDEPSIRDYLKTVLVAEGYTVHGYGDPEEAVKTLDDSYDSVLLDIRMPGMSGIELYAYILQKVPALDGKIIFITGDTSDAEVKGFLKSNNLPCLSKPLELDNLKQKISSVLKPSGSRQTS